MDKRDSECFFFQNQYEFITAIISQFCQFPNRLCCINSNFSPDYLNKNRFGNFVIFELSSKDTGGGETRPTSDYFLQQRGEPKQTHHEGVFRA